MQKGSTKQPLHYLYPYILTYTTKIFGILYKAQNVCKSKDYGLLISMILYCLCMTVITIIEECFSLVVGMKNIFFTLRILINIGLFNPLFNFAIHIYNHFILPKLNDSTRFKEVELPHNKIKLINYKKIVNIYNKIFDTLPKPYTGEDSSPSGEDEYFLNLRKN